MAKSVNKHINIYLDGKQVENSVTAIRKEMKQLTEDMNNAQIGSDKYVRNAKKIQELKKILNEHREGIKATGIEWKNLIDDFGKFTIAAFGLLRVINKVRSLTSEFGEEFAKLDKVMATTQRATGMTREEVGALNEEFKKIDTTTPVEQLHNLAAIGAKLGYNTKAEILEFTEAANQIKVIFGEDFDIAGLTKLVKVFGEDDRLGIRGALMATGSAMGRLSRQTGQSAADLMEFTHKTAVLGKEAGLTQSQIMGFGATLMANLQDAGVSAQAFNRLISKVYSDSSKFAKAAGVDVKKAAKNITIYLQNSKNSTLILSPE